MLLWVDLLESSDPRDKELAISAPPEFWKSRTIRMWLEWDIGRNPEAAHLLVMNAAEQAMKQVLSVRETIDYNPRYHQVFPHIRSAKAAGKDFPWTSTNLVIERENAARPDSTLFGTGVLGPIQGGHYEVIILDDVSDQHDVNSESTMRQQREWVRGVLIDRLMRTEDDVPVGRICAILTRWSAGDLWETYISDDPDEGMGMRAVMTPAVARDGETYPWGKVLWPEEFPEEKLLGILRRKGSRLYTLTFLCDPVAAGGLKFKRADFRRYDLHNPPKFTYVLHSWDTAGGLSKDASNSVMEEWCIGPMGFYLTYVWAKRARYAEIKSRMYQMTHERLANVTLLEYKHSGQLLYDDIEAEALERGGIPGLKKINPIGDKEMRADLIEPIIESHMVWIPQDGQVPWVEPFLMEVTGFPAGRFKDRVDSMTQALEFLRKYRSMRGTGSAGSHMGEGPTAPTYDIDLDEFTKVPPVPNFATSSYM